VYKLNNDFSNQEIVLTKHTSLEMKTRIILTILSLTIGLNINGQATTDSTGVLSLGKAQEMALSYNKSVIKSKIQFDQMGYDVESYKSHRMPRIELMVTDLYSTARSNFKLEGGHLPIYTLNEASGSYFPNVKVNSDGSYTLLQYADFPTQNFELKMKNLFIGGIQLTQPIYTGGKITSAINMAEIGQQMASVNIRLTEDEIIMKVDEAYMQAVRAKELNVVAESYYAMLQELERTVDSAVRHGLRLRNDLMKVQVKLNEAELGKQKAENAYLLCRMNICHLTGLPLTEASNIEIDTFTANQDRLLPSTSVDVTRRPEYTILSKKADLAREEVNLTRSEYLPNVALFGGFVYANGGELAGKRMLDNGSFSIGVMVKVPLFNFGEGSNKIRSAQARAQLAAIELSEKSELMELEIAMCHNELEECHTEVAIAHKSFDQASENLRLSKSAYDNGVELLSDYFEAQAIWREASATLVEARCKLYLAYTKYLKATGQLR